MPPIGRRGLGLCFRFYEAKSEQDGEELRKRANSTGKLRIDRGMQLRFASC